MLGGRGIDHPAYALRRRVETVAFRQAWDAAMEYAISRLAGAAVSRALHGIARPVFHKGELIGERRYYDERLTMFLLRLRDPARFGGWRDRTPFNPPGDLARSPTAGSAPPIANPASTTATGRSFPSAARLEIRIRPRLRRRWVVNFLNFRNAGPWLRRPGPDREPVGSNRPSRSLIS